MRLLRVALTGGIATGKSYCATRLRALGAPVIDADVVARDVVAPGSRGLAAIAARFGAGVLTSDGALDRGALARIVFHDDAARRDLEAITHPLVYDVIANWFAAQAAHPPAHGIAIADIPLLYETGRAGAFDCTIVAACSPEQQFERVMARDGLTADEAARRIAAQMPIGDKAARADFVIDTSGSFESTDRQIDDVWTRLSERAARQP